jgi:hypothetical protein
MNTWDLTHPAGVAAEKWFGTLPENAKLEVKAELGQWKRTGNICVEFSCSGKPSGIATTEADYWVHILQHEGEREAVLIFKVPLLRERLVTYAKSGHISMTMGGDNNAAHMYLVPLNRIHLFL